MFFLLARDSDGSLRLLSPATFETRRDALDELARVARSSASFSEPDEVFVGDLDAVSPVLLVRVGDVHAEEVATALPPVAEVYPVEPAYAEAVLADNLDGIPFTEEPAESEEPAETVEETLIEAAVDEEVAEPGVSGPDQTAWPWLAELPETAAAAEAADSASLSEPAVAEVETGEPETLSWLVPLESEVQPAVPEPVPLEAEPQVDAYEPPAYEEPSVDAVAFVPPAEDVYVPRPVIMGDYAEPAGPTGWDEIREPQGVTEAESELVDPFAAVEAPVTGVEDLQEMPDQVDLEEAIEEPVITDETTPVESDDEATAMTDAANDTGSEAASDEPMVVTDPEETPDLGLPMWQPETPAVPPSEIPVAESAEGWTEADPFGEMPEAPAAEAAPAVPVAEPAEPVAHVEVPEEASAAFPGLEAFLASRGVTPDIKAVPTGMPQAEQPAASVAPPSTADTDAVGYEVGGSDLSASTCDDCVYVNTCPKAHQSTPADCGSFQWKAV